MDAVQALKERRSVRSFADQPVDETDIETLIDCARNAPTAGNIQPWEFVVVTEPDRLGKLAGMTDHGKFMAQGQACIAVFCQDTKYYLEDGSAATTNILVAAHSLGLGTCWVAGDKKPYAEAVRLMFDIPQGYKLVSLIALGYPADKPAAKDKRPLAELIHWQKW